MRTICVLGLGYIGLPTACLFAVHGNKVTGVDINLQVVQKLNQRELHFKENGIEEIFFQALDSGNLKIESAPVAADVFIIAVPTPVNEDHSSKLDYVKNAIGMIAKVLRKGNLVVLESTVPPLTTVKLLKPILEKTGLKMNEDFFIAHCPERAIPGKTLFEMVNNDRIIGGSCKKAADMAREVYSSFVRGKLFLTDTTTAETVKLVENAYRDTNIAFANELAIIADELGINVWELIELANKHPRVNVHKPGPGVGGHCIALDPWFLTETTRISELIPLVRKVNDSMPKYVFQLVRKMVSGIENPTVTIFGVAYKGDVDDTRETPALKLIKLLEWENYNIVIHDPHVKSFSYKLSSFEDAVKDSDCVVIVADHTVFKNLAPESLDGMRNRNIIDTRNCIDEKRFKDAGFNVKILGKGN